MERKEAYVAPELTVYGSLVSNTEGMGGSWSDEGSSGEPTWGYHRSPAE